MFQRRKIRRSLFIVTVFGILALMIVPTPVQAARLRNKQIDVFTAQSLIENAQNNGLLILDVRSAGEFLLGHIQGAFSMPFDQLELRVNEIDIFKDRQVLVYCRSGVTSQMAAEVLLIHGFINVYDMIGGIHNWVGSGLPIWTASHSVTIDSSNSMKVESFLSRLVDCSTCSGSTGCSHSNLTQDYQSVVVEQSENHIVQVVTFLANNTVIEATVTTTDLVKFSEVSPDTNRTLRFFSSVVSVEDMTFSRYGLVYQVNHTNFRLSLQTILIPKDTNSYNQSSSMVEFIPTDSSEIISLEFIEINKLATLSEVYQNVALVVSEIEEEYSESPDPYHNVLAQRYIILSNQLSILSSLVDDQLIDYNKFIHQSVAIVFDACTWECWSSSWSDCFGYATPSTMLCLWSCVLGCLPFGPLFYTVCLTPCFTVCAVADVIWAVFCAIIAIYDCCTGNGGGGGGCPILSVFDGNEFISQGVLDIHSTHDTIRTSFIHTNSIPVNNRYLMRLTEQSQNISYIDHIQLFARVNGGRLIKLQLVSAIHSTEGNVLRQLKHSDNVRIATIGASDNNGVNQYIDLKFVSVMGFEISQLIFVIEGFNPK